MTSNVWFRVYRNETTTLEKRDTLEEKDYSSLPVEEDMEGEDNSTQNLQDKTTENYTISL